MPRPFSACHHPERAEIDAQFVTGIPRLRMAQYSGLSEPAVRRHFRLHLPEALRMEAEMERQEAAAELRAILRASVADLRRQAERARHLRHDSAILRAMRLSFPLLKLQVDVLSRSS